MPAKKPQTTTGKSKAAPKKKAVPLEKKTEEQVTTPLMTSHASADGTTLRTRRNKSSVIERTDRFKNIEDGLIPFNYATGGYHKGQPI